MAAVACSPPRPSPLLSAAVAAAVASAAGPPTPAPLSKALVGALSSQREEERLGADPRPASGGHVDPRSTSCGALGSQRDEDYMRLASGPASCGHVDPGSTLGDALGAAPPGTSARSSGAGAYMCGHMSSALSIAVNMRRAGGTVGRRDGGQEGRWDGGQEGGAYMAECWV